MAGMEEKYLLGGALSALSECYSGFRDVNKQKAYFIFNTTGHHTNVLSETLITTVVGWRQNSPGL